MKKTAVYILSLLVILSAVSCRAKRAPTSPGSVSYTNTGRIQSSSLSTYVGITITASSTYYYDMSGKIRYTDNTVMGYSQEKTNYKYNSSGKLICIDYADGTDDEYYTYDSSGRLSAHFTVDSVSNTGDASYYTYGSDGLISRVDDYLNGSPHSYRILHRDASGYVTSEDIYTAAGVLSPLSSVIYTRNDVTKVITLDIVFNPGTGVTASISNEFKYDPSGFLLEKNLYLNAIMMVMSFLQTYTLQSGPFDAAGINGYYYTDKDLYGLANFYISAW